MSDALKEVLEDPEIHEIRVAALKIEAVKDPVGFELKFVMPLKQKLTPEPGEAEFIEMTAEEEEAFMEERTSAEIAKAKEELKANGQPITPQTIATAVNA